MEDHLNKPVYTEDFKELSRVSYEYLFEQQKVITEAYGIHQYEEWYYDQDTGILNFSSHGSNIVSFKYEEVVSISKISNTWLWSWANPHIGKEVTQQIGIIREYGLMHNLEHLYKDKWFADEYDGWEMTAITAYILKAKGAYRFPLENTFSYVVYKEIVELNSIINKLI